MSPPLLAAAGLLLLLAAAAAGWMLRPLAGGPAQTGTVRFSFAMGVPGRDGLALAISPDGRRIIQAVSDSAGTPRIVMRELGSTELTPIPGTEGARSMAFSPDGDWIAFTTGATNQLRKVPARGGPSTVVADSGGWPAWATDGMIYYTAAGRGLRRVSSSGGVPELVTEIDTARREFGHFTPQALPGNRGIIYTSYATPLSRARIEAYDLATRRKKVLVEGAVFGRYASSGHLLYVRDQAIFAVPFDLDALEVRGSAVPVQDDAAWDPSGGLAGFDVSSNGTLVYLRASEWNVDRRLVWIDRAGVESPVLSQPGAYAEPRISPDGRLVALTITRPKLDIWLYERARGVLTRLTRANAAAFSPVWLPDSRSIVYSHEDPVYDINHIPVDGSAPTRPVVAGPLDKIPSSVSPDGKLVAYTQVQSGFMVYAAPIDGSGKPRRLIASEVNNGRAAFSPTGKWVAFEEETGDRGNVFIAAADGSGGRRQVSLNGGMQARWTRGGREIVYLRGDQMFAVPVDPATGEVGAPAELFRRRPFNLDLGTISYDVTADGSRFIMAVSVERADAQPFVVVLNWFEELKGKVSP